MGTSILVLQKDFFLCQSTHLRVSWSVPFLISRAVPAAHRRVQGRTVLRGLTWNLWDWGPSPHAVSYSAAWGRSRWQA